MLKALTMRLIGHRSPEGSLAERDLVSIRTYCDFLRKNPTMPSEHRDRFLKQIACSAGTVRLGT